MGELTGKITAIRPDRGRQKRVKVSLDNKLAFSLDAGVAKEERLQIGQELSEERINSLVKSDHFTRCLNAAFLFLSYRPRSEGELKERLQRRGFNGENIEKVIAKLKEQKLVDDLAFARFWKDNRDSFSPRGQRLIKLELKQKGVNASIVDEIVDTTDDTENAYNAAMHKARSLRRVDYPTFRRRLGEYLQRRGFDFALINRVIERVWQEKVSIAE